MIYTKPAIYKPENTTPGILLGFSSSSSKGIKEFNGHNNHNAIKPACHRQVYTVPAPHEGPEEVNNQPSAFRLERLHLK